MALGKSKHDKDRDAYLSRLQADAVRHMQEAAELRSRGLGFLDEPVKIAAKLRGEPPLDYLAQLFALCCLVSAADASDDMKARFLVVFWGEIRKQHNYRWTQIDLVAEVMKTFVEGARTDLNGEQLAEVRVRAAALHEQARLPRT